MYSSSHNAQDSNRTEAAAEKEEMTTNTKRLRGNPRLYEPFPTVPAAQEWLSVFKF